MDLVGEAVKAILLIGGSGGLIWSVYLWINAYRSRRRLRVEFVREHYDVHHQPNVAVTLEVDATNLGDRPTALAPSIAISALDALTRKPLRFDLTLSRENRTLEPHTPRPVIATGVTGASYTFSWYRRYSISITRGRRAIIRHLNASHEEVGIVRYWIGYFAFRVFGKLPGDA